MNIFAARLASNPLSEGYDALRFLSLTPLSHISMSIALALLALPVFLASQRLDREGSEVWSFTVGELLLTCVIWCTLTGLVELYLLLLEQVKSEVYGASGLEPGLVSEFITSTNTFTSTNLTLVGIMWAVMVYLVPLFVIKRTPLRLKSKIVLLLGYACVACLLFSISGSAYRAKAALRGDRLSAEKSFVLHLWQPQIWKKSLSSNLRETAP